MLPTSGPFSRATGTVIEDYSTDFGSYLGAEAGAAWDLNPLPSIFRWAKRQAEEGTIIGIPGITPDFKIPDEYLSKRLTADEANERSKHLGLKFKKPLRENTLTMLMDRKEREIRFKATMAQAEGMNTYGLGTLTSLVTTALDPINVASAFVPVVGPARHAANIARMGATGARAARGAVEGAVGAALVEPIVLGVALDEQAEYGLFDSLMNVTFGSVLGSGFHVVGGKIGDWLNVDSAVSPTMRGRLSAREQLAHVPHETREAALRQAVNDILETGKVQNVEALLALDPHYRAASLANDLRGSTSVIGLGSRVEGPAAGAVKIMNKSDFLDPANLTRQQFIDLELKKGNAGRLGAEQVEVLREQVEQLRAEVSANRDKSGNAARRKTLAARENTLRKLEEQFGEGVDRISELEAQIATKDRARVKANDKVKKKKLADEIKRLRRELKREKESIGYKDPEVRASELHRDAVMDAITRGEAVPDHVLRDYPDLDDFAQAEGLAVKFNDNSPSAPASPEGIELGKMGRQHFLRKVTDDYTNPDNASLVDPDIIVHMDEKLAKGVEAVDSDAARTLSDEVRQMVDDTLKAAGLDEKDLAEIRGELKMADDALAEAEVQAKAIEAAGMCQMRKAA